MDSNQRNTDQLPASEESERVFEVAQSLVPAAKAFARKNRLDPAYADEAMLEAAKRVVAARSSPSETSTTPIKNLPAYLYKIGRRLMVDKFNQTKNDVQLTNHEVAVNPVGLIERQILVSEIVSRMGPKARAIFRYRTLGYGYDEIAKEFKRMGYKATGGSLRSELSKVTKRITEELQITGEDLLSN